MVILTIEAPASLLKTHPKYGVQVFETVTAVMAAKDDPACKVESQKIDVMASELDIANDILLAYLHKVREHGKDPDDAQVFLSAMTELLEVAYARWDGRFVLVAKWDGR